MAPDQIVTHNFTLQYSGLAAVLTTDILVGHPVVNNVKVADGSTDPEAVFPSQAIWDTGATNTVITQRAAEALGLKPITKTLVTGVNSQSQENVYLVSIVLPNNVGVRMVRVTECKQLSHPDDPNQCDVLLGMDIITMGDFVITNLGGQTMMSFRMPSIERIDFRAGQPYVSPVQAKKPLIRPALSKSNNKKHNKKKK